MIGQWTTDRPPAARRRAGGLDLRRRPLAHARRVAAAGGTVLGRPQLDGGERWLAEVDDPAGNRIGIVVPVRTARSRRR